MKIVGRASYNTKFAQWAARCGGSAGEVGELWGTAVDTLGNVFISGNFYSNPLSIYNSDGTTWGTLPYSGADDDVFLIKYNSSGFAQWAARCAGASGEACYGITVDSSGNVYITGFTYSNPLTIYNSDGTIGKTLANSGAPDGFIIKYNSSGFVQWATRCGGSGYELSCGLAIDSSGNIYAGGYYGSNPLIIYNSDGSTWGTLANSGGVHGFTVKYNSSGFAQWATRFGGTGNTDTSYRIAVDGSGNVYVSGYYDSNPLIIYNSDGTTWGTLANSGGYDGFTVKYNSSGFAQWATRIAGTGIEITASISTDTRGNVYVAGLYNSNPLTIYNSNGTSSGITLPNSGGDDIYVAKYNTSGIAQWATRFGGTGVDLGYSISTDTNGNVYVTGSYNSNPLTIYNSDGSTWGTLANSGVFIVKCNSSGFVQAATRFGSSGSGRGIKIDAYGTVYIVGNYNSNPLTIYNSDGSTWGTLPISGTGNNFFIIRKLL